jgi:hypothetical protein
MSSGAVVRIRREASPWKDRLRKYKVLIDGAVVARLRNGEESEFSVPAGRHSIEVRIDWTGSDVVDFTADNGEIVEFLCGATSVLAVHKAFQSSGYVGLMRIGTTDT